VKSWTPLGLSKATSPASQQSIKYHLASSQRVREMDRFVQNFERIFVQLSVHPLQAVPLANEPHKSGNRASMVSAIRVLLRTNQGQLSYLVNRDDTCRRMDHNGIVTWAERRTDCFSLTIPCRSPLGQLRRVIPRMMETPFL
jgi:hypothetical protein